MAGIRGRRDRRAASPAVGVVLLLALSVLIAATVAAVVFTTRDPAAEAPPTAAFAFEYDPGPAGDDALAVVYEHGDPIATSSLYFVVEGARCAGGAADPNGRLNVMSDYPGVSGDVTPGMTFLVGASVTGCQRGRLDLRDAEVGVVWVSGSQSKRLATWHGAG